jgi:hypothetical protein
LKVQQLLLLLLGAEHVDRAHRESRLNAQDRSERAVAPIQLHVDQAGRDRAHRRTAGSGEPVTYESELPHPPCEVER